MMKKTLVVRLILCGLLAGAFSTVPALAGSAVIGSVAGSMNATIGGQSLLPNTTIFSGDSVQVRDGVAVIAMGNNSRVIFGRDTVASFLRDSNEVTVLLSQGSVSMLHPDDGTAVQVKTGEVSVRPAAGFKTLGEVAMLNGAVVVTAKEGALQVDDHGATKKVTKGQTVVISPKTSDHASGAGAGWGGGNEALEVAALAAGVSAAIMAGIAVSRSGSARDASELAYSSANAAASAASAAQSSAAAAATAANSAASSAAAAYLLAACDYNLARTGTLTSPITFSGGSACP